MKLKFLLSFNCIFILCLQIKAQTYTSDKSRNLSVVYLIPSDLDTIANFNQRLGPVMLYAQEWYRQQMVANGFGNKTFGILRDTVIKRVPIHVIRSTQNKATLNGGGPITNEVNAWFASHPGIKTSEHVLILLPPYSYTNNDPTKPVAGPYYGYDRYCIAMDCQYMDTIYKGSANFALWVGGMMHEVGHALQLPHNNNIYPDMGNFLWNPSTNAANFPTYKPTLMGIGNYTLEIYNTVLSKSDCAMLNANEIFNNVNQVYYGNTNSGLKTIHGIYNAVTSSMEISGRFFNRPVSGTTIYPINDIAIYADPQYNNELMGVNGDYNAISYAVKPIGTDSFYINIPISNLQFQANTPYEIKIKLIHSNGKIKETISYFNFVNGVPVMKFHMPNSLVSLNRNSWTVTSSTQHPGNLASALIDSNITTFWHSNYQTNPAASYPHTITIDLGQVQSTIGFGYSQRDNVSRAMKDVTLSVSSNGINYTTIGNYLFKKAEGLEYIPFPSRQNFRYLRLTGTSSWDGTQFAALGEVYLYNAPLPAKKLLFIGVDGCRWDAILAANTPNIDSLVAHSIYSGNGLTEYKTWSGTGWSNMLTGVWHTKHGVTDNTFVGSNFGQYKDFITLAEAYNNSYRTISIAHWASINSNIIQAIDSEITLTTDLAVKNSAVSSLTTDNPDILFVDFDDVDHAGHTNGFSPTIVPYLQTIETTDAYIGQVITALKNRPNYALEDWLVVLTTDHGGNTSGHGGGTLDERTIFNVYSNPSFTPQNISRSTTIKTGAFNEARFNAGTYAVPINQTPFTFGATQDFTIELWVKASSFTSDPALISNKNWNSGLNKGFVISCTAGQYWKVNVGDGTKRLDIHGGTLAANQWHHLAVTFDRDGMMTAYEDGVVVGFEKMSGIGNINSGLPLVINQDGTKTYSLNFSGSIKDVRIWNTVIPANTLLQWSTIPVTNQHPNYNKLLANYKCEDGSGSILDDASANNNNANVTGSISWLTSTTDTLRVYDYLSTPREVDNAVTALNWLCVPYNNLDGRSWVGYCSPTGTNKDTLTLRVYMQGFYLGNDSMRAVLDPINQPTICDSITIELHEISSPNVIAYSSSSVISVTGFGKFSFPPDVTGKQYYIAIRNRNALQTWSKSPIQFTSQNITVDFTR